MIIAERGETINYQLILRDLKAIIFDMDGVLTSLPEEKIIPKFILEESFPKEVLIRAFDSLEAIPHKLYWKTEDLKTEIFQKVNLEDNLVNEKIFKKFSKKLLQYNFEHSIISHHPELDWILPLLANKYILSIVTNNVSESVQIFLGNWLSHFQNIKTWECMPLIKPDEQGFCGLCQEIGVKPEETIFIGDSISDIETATKAGAYSMAATWYQKKQNGVHFEIKQKNIQNSKFLGFIDSLEYIAVLFLD